MIRTTLMGLMVAVLAGQPVLAYEEDVHYGLTRWLAIHAGFSLAEADTIATENVSYDHSMLSATRLVFHYACLDRDSKASELVKDYHFPSDGAIPSEPSTRKVMPGSLAALRKTEERIVLPSQSMSDNIKRLGQGLHPLQDSWSHQGIPGSPVESLCERTLSWGHPADRGGWRTHDADLTFLHPLAETTEMARSTYGQLCKFRDKVLRKACKNGAFEGLKKDVEDFASAPTKKVKVQWFKSHGFAETDFLDATSLPEGADYARATSDSTRKIGSKIVPLSKAGTVAKTDAGRFMLGFFTAWMTQPNTAAVVSEWMAPIGFRRNFAGVAGNARVNPKTLEMQLQLWRVRDHGSVAVDPKRGHDLMQASGGELADLAPRLARESVPYESVEQALLPLDVQGLPVFAGEWKSPDGRVLFLGTARLRHAPNDALLVVADRVAGKYKVISLGSVVEH